MIKQSSMHIGHKDNINDYSTYKRLQKFNLNDPINLADIEYELQQKKLMKKIIQLELLNI